jgi:uncharacterized protein (DUF1800 family)
MDGRTHARMLSLIASFLLLSLVPTFALAVPAIQRVVSRVNHGATPYDIPMPQSGAGGIECRAIASVAAGSVATTIVVSFDATITGGSAAVTGGTATANAPTFSGSDMLIPLQGVANAQTVTLTLSNVTDGQGNTLPSAAVFFRVLEGDVNGSGSVSVSDINLAKYRQGSALSYATFRDDVDLNGSIAAADTTLVKARINTSVGAAAVNTPPTISNISDQSTPAGTAVAPISFTISDGESAPNTLYVSAASSDNTLIPAANISITGATSARTLNITPAATGTGTATITVTVSDGVLVTTDTFVLTVGGANKLYVAVMGAEDGSTKTPGTGSATLLVDANETQAVLRFNYSNMTSNKVGSHIHGPADPGQVGQIIFDIDMATPQADGSYLWTFVQSGNTTVQDIRDALHAGRFYINIHSAIYPAGELRGHFNFADGSTTFTPPPPPPALPGGPPTDQDAARFLTQATFGLVPDDTTDPSQTNHTIAALKQMGYDAWLSNQFSTPATSMKSIIEARITAPDLNYTLSASNVTDVWWYLALKSPDQLRQRIGYAYSETFVVSKVDETISSEPLGLASYHDMLANDAFGNFRTLLKDVTLHPIMGWYLNMLGNKKPVSPNFRPPNENYAREVLQLFTIGLNETHPDGTLKLDTSGLPIPTYDQTTIQNFAQVFTGWSNNGPVYPYKFWDATLVPPGLNSTLSTRYVNPMVVTAGNHSNANKNLLNGFVITGLPSYTATTANAELDAALDNIFNHPNVGPFICRRLIQHLVTSNPSPAYVYRVSEIFRDNGQGVRGDMKAVIKAILMDYEARTTDLLGNEGYGRLKEPLLRASQVIRAFHPFSNATATPNKQYFRLASTDTEFLQTPYRANSVFNFFDPDYVVSLSLVNTKLNVPYIESIRSPVMEITNENSTINYANFMKKGLIDGSGFSSSSDVRLLLTNENALATAASSTNLINYLDKVMMAGITSTNTRTLLNGYYISTTDATKRARGLIYLIATSPQFQVQK